jgi:hypothetical protein
VVGSINVGADVDVSATALCPDAKTAEDIRDEMKKGLEQVRGLLALAALGGQGLPSEVTELLDLEAKVSGNNVTVTKTVKVAPLIKAYKEMEKKAGKPIKP